MDLDARTRDTLHLIAVHIVAGARQQATGRFSLRVAPGGFGTPEFGDDARRVRVSGTTLVVESDASGAAAARSIEIVGATWRELAAFAGVDLATPVDVGHDTPPLGDVDATLALDSDTTRAIAGWFARVNVALDAVITHMGRVAAATPVRLWPEHFDVATDLAAAPGVRANVGGSPGDAFSSEPYLYVGPWGAERPGDRAFWNAPFGAARTASELADDDPVAGAVDFVLVGLGHLATPS